MAKIKKKHLLSLGYPTGPVIKAALAAMEQAHFQGVSRERKQEILQMVWELPEKFAQDLYLGELAKCILAETGKATTDLSLREKALSFPVYGEENIAQGALDQMETAMRLPISRAGALMPDAHVGYGLPIGGVLATEGAIIPYAVGVDIGCRMCLSLLDIPPSFLDQRDRFLQEVLVDQTCFGAGKGFGSFREDPVLDHPAFKDIQVAKDLKDKAAHQLGSSGSGNHFVEFGLVTLTDPRPALNLPAGTYLGLLSHSGSRGLGAGIANYFCQIARDRMKLPKPAQHLAWLDLSSEPGEAYWMAMQLAGEYASACHRVIHDKIIVALGAEGLGRVENHHNFAWQETWQGKTWVIHRKGATPAGENVLGVIPGSMTAPGFIVSGKGHPGALGSASHGAGRHLSRRAAKSSLTMHQLKRHLKDQKVSLIGGSIDEAPMAYKDIHQVMRYQHALVDVLGTFQPRIVRMDCA